MSNLSTIKLTDTQKRDIQSYCKTNNIEDVEKFVKDCFRQGFDVKRYGLLGDDNTSKPGVVEEKWVEKEVIREIRVEVPVEVIKEVEIIKEVVVEKPVEIIKEVPVEKLVEVIKEVPVEKIVTKTEYITDDTKVNELIQKIKELESREPEIIEKEVIKETRVEIPVEVIKEVIVEKPVEVIVEKKIVDDKSKMLQETLQSLRKELNLKNEKIKQLEQSLKDLESIATAKGAVFLKNSNINENL